ncbi:hypothetical protein LA080_000890 [Diaporthe eres]|nr:hypothetical protein LA080_000890 [Diaporthe eres]
MQPDYHQQQGKKRFVKSYQNWVGMETPNDVQQLEDLYSDIQIAMEALDTFFFRRHLTRLSPNEEHYEMPVADLKVQNNIFVMGQPGHQAYLGIGLPLLLGAAARMSDGRVTIFIDTLVNGSPRSVESIFETLVHEMAHAIFHSFACRRGDCTRIATRPGILGQYGHGDMWVGMAEHMKNTIQGWDKDLAHFYNTDDIRRHNRELN